MSAPLKSKYPAYGKILADRMKWSNPPMFVFICIGGNAFSDAKKHNLDRDKSAMVLTPEIDPLALIWPVSGCPVVIEWDGSAQAKLIIELVKCLLRALAISVTVYPTWEDFSSQPGHYNKSRQPIKFTHSRETIRTYYPKQVQS